MLFSIWAFQPLSIRNVPPCKAYTHMFPLNGALGCEGRPPNSKAMIQWTKTAYLLRACPYCFAFILHVYLSAYCVSASAPSFLRCSLLKSQSFWFFRDFCTIQNVIFWCKKCFQCAFIYSFTLLSFWCHIIVFFTPSYYQSSPYCHDHQLPLRATRAHSITDYCKTSSPIVHCLGSSSMIVFSFLIYPITSAYIKPGSSVTRC